MSSCKKNENNNKEEKEADEIRSENIARHSEIIASSSGETHGESECSR